MLIPHSLTIQLPANCRFPKLELLNLRQQTLYQRLDLRDYTCLKKLFLSFAESLGSIKTPPQLEHIYMDCSIVQDGRGELLTSKLKGLHVAPNNLISVDLLGDYSIECLGHIFKACDHSSSKLESIRLTSKPFQRVCKSLQDISIPEVLSKVKELRIDGLFNDKLSDINSLFPNLALLRLDTGPDITIKLLQEYIAERGQGLQRVKVSSHLIGHPMDDVQKEINMNLCRSELEEQKAAVVEWADQHGVKLKLRPFGKGTFQRRTMLESFARY